MYIHIFIGCRDELRLACVCIHKVKCSVCENMYMYICTYVYMYMCIIHGLLRYTTTCSCLYTQGNVHGE